MMNAERLEAILSQYEGEPADLIPVLQDMHGRTTTICPRTN